MSEGYGSRWDAKQDREERESKADITKESLVQRGYVFDELVGYNKKIGDAHILIGAPLNQICVYLRFLNLPGNVITEIGTLEQIDQLETLLSGCYIDHDFGCVEEDEDSGEAT